MNQFNANIYKTDDEAYHFTGEIISGFAISEYADPTDFKTEEDAKNALQKFCQEKGYTLSIK